MVNINTDQCVGCGNCVPQCGVHAITIVNDKAYCDDSLCVLCGVCISACPVNAISNN